MFVVTPEVSHPRRGKRARRPRLRRHGVGCHGGGTLGGGSLLPESRFSALAHRGVPAGEKEGDAKEAREVRPDTHPVRGGQSSSLASKPSSNTFRSRPRRYGTSIAPSGLSIVVIRTVQTSVAGGTLRKELPHSPLVLKKRVFVIEEINVCWK